MPNSYITNLWTVIKTAASLRDVAQTTRRYQFAVVPPVTFYADVEHATLRIARWQKAEIQVQATLQAGFGWQIATEQDNAGVYWVAKRRAVVGSIGQAQFSAYVPVDTYLVLKLVQCHVEFQDLTQTLHIPPAASGSTIFWQPE
jgi:hypothetical protein